MGLPAITILFIVFAWRQSWYHWPNILTDNIQHLLEIIFHSILLVIYILKNTTTFLAPSRGIIFLLQYEITQTMNIFWYSTYLDTLFAAVVTCNWLFCSFLTTPLTILSLQYGQVQPQPDPHYHNDPFYHHNWLVDRNDYKNVK